MRVIAIASHNPVKAKAALSGFQRMFPEETFQVETVSVPSGVEPQPLTDDDTLRGAVNRAEQAARSAPHADYWVGIEGGIEELNGELAAFAWIVVRSQELVGKSRSGAFFLPARVAEIVRSGAELGDAIDRVFGQSNSKQQSGAIGALTEKEIDRTDLYEHAMVLALVPFKNRELYHSGGA